MAITRIQADILNKKLAELMKTFAAENGLSTGNQRMVFNEAICKVTIEFGDKSAIGDINPVYYKECASKGWNFGLSVKQIGTEIKTAKGIQKFVGMRGKFAIVQSADGSYWKQDPVIVAALLKKV